MRPEDFDKRLNQKLGELNPAFKETDWIRLSKKLNSNKSNKAAYFYKFRYVLLAMLIVTVLGIAYQQNLFDFKPWNSNIEVKSNAGQNLELAAVPVDLNQSLTSTNTIIGQSNAIAKEQKQSQVFSPKPSVFSGMHSTKTRNSAVHEKNPDANLYSAKTQKTNLPPTESTFNALLNTTLSAENLKSNNQEAGIEFENQSTLHSNQDVTRSSKDLKSTQEMLSIEKLACKDINVLNSTETKPKAKLKPMQGIKPNYWLVGAVSLITERHVNVGIGFEKKTNKNISFSSGLVFQNYFQQSFSDQGDFANTTEEEFTNLIKPRHSKSSDFTNIRIKSQDLLLPLQLKYYFPFNTQYAAFVTGGIQLTLKSKTILDFDYISWDTNTEMVEVDFDQASNRATLINHFVIGIGLQREFRNISCQASVLLQKNNTNQAHIAKMEPAFQIGLYYKL
ncbi:MAG: hypothetical protein IPL42_03700 [Saprospiraceae bacterium]|nr:hypothetical protein [Saprospiraceae bacterium]